MELGKERAHSYTRVLSRQAQLYIHIASAVLFPARAVVHIFPGGGLSAKRRAGRHRRFPRTTNTAAQLLVQLHHCWLIQSQQPTFAKEIQAQLECNQFILLFYANIFSSLWDKLFLRSHIPVNIG